MQRGLLYAATALALTLAGAAAFVFGGKPGPVSAAPAPAAPQNLQLAENIAPTAPQGASLGATGAQPSGAPQGTSLGSTGAAPKDAASEADAAGGNLVTTPTGGQRVLSQSALDMVKQIDGNASNPLDFQKTQDGRFWKLTFAALGSFKYEVPDPDVIRKSATPDKAPTDQIPAKLKEMNGQQTLIVGFMVPIEITREGKVKSFALTQNQQFCCFGVPPAMNEWVMVTMDEGKLADYIMDLPVAAYGELKVGEEIDDGYVLSMYRMKSTEVITAPELLKRTKAAS